MSRRIEKSKSHFVGLRINETHKSVLSKLQEISGMSKTELLLKGLELLGDYYTLGFDQPTLSFELKRLEDEALHYASVLKQIRERGKAIKLVVQEIRDIDAIVDKFGADKSYLIQILLDVQKKYNWLPRLALMWISERLNVPMSTIMSVATFYKAFSLAPRGRHLIRVCMGTSCKVRGAPIILDNLQRLLDVDLDGTTSDGRFSLKRVNCLACCALGPMMTVDGEYYGGVKLSKVKTILSKYG